MSDTRHSRATRRKKPESHLLEKGWDDERGLPSEAPDNAIEVSEGRDPAAPRAAMLSGWRLLRQEPTMVVWSAFGEFFAGVLKFAPMFVVLIAVTLRTQGAELGSTAGILTWIIETVRWFFSLEVLSGVFALVAVTASIAWTMGVAIDSGILGALSKRLVAPNNHRGRLFLKSLGDRFLTLLWWGILRGVLMVTFGAVAVGMCWAAYSVVSGLGPVLTAMGVGITATIGVCAWAAVAMVTHLALGPMILEDKGVGESLHDAAALMVERFVEVIWLYLLAGLLFLVVWGVYTPFYAISMVMGAEEELAVAGALLQMVVDTTMILAMAAASIWCRGGVLSWFAIRSGKQKKLPALLEESEEAQSAQSSETGEPNAETDKPLLQPESALPSTHANIFTFEELRREMREET